MESSSTIGSVPFVIELSSMDNCMEGQSPEPLVVLIPRTSYLVSLIQVIREAFSMYVVNFGHSHTVWLKSGEVAVPWHYPAGVIFDVLRARSQRGGDYMPVTLVARVKQPLKDDARDDPKDPVPQDVPLCNAGQRSTLDPATPPGASPSSPVEDVKRERRETSAAVSMFIKQNLKGSLAAAYGTTKHFITLDPKLTQYLVEPLLAVEERMLSEDLLIQNAKAQEHLRRQYVGAVGAGKLCVTLFDGVNSITEFIPPLIVVLSVSEEDRGIMTIGDVYTKLFDDGKGPLAKIVQLKSSSSSSSSSAVFNSSQQHVDVAMHGGLREFRILTRGIVLPWETPLSFVLKNLLDLDMRLYLVVVPRC